MKALDLGPIRQAIAPYALAIKASLALLLLTCSFIRGCQQGEQQQAAELAKVRGQLAGANAALTGAANALDQVNQEAARRIAADKKAREDAERASTAATAAAAQLQHQLRDINARLERANRKPACAALLAQDLHEVCDL